MPLLKTKTYTGLPRADVEYEAKIINDEIFIFMYDLNRGNRSLTNDMQAVLFDLKSIFNGLHNAVIIYQDSEGCFDQVIFRKNNTFSFRILLALDEDEAIYIWLKQNISSLKQYSFFQIGQPSKFIIKLLYKLKLKELV
ncbi:hypothetical protein [Sulfurimonas sp.]|uniref:hypothetical protein n=1 Tax=Sulfurimonas sp. TaxID=2022749 RepID=UPI003562E748